MDFMNMLSQFQGRKPAVPTSLGFPNMSVPAGNPSPPIMAPAAAQAGQPRVAPAAAAPVPTSTAPIENHPVDVIGAPQPVAAPAAPAAVQPGHGPHVKNQHEKDHVGGRYERMGLGDTVRDYLSGGGSMRDVRDATRGLGGMARRQMGAPGLIDLLQQRLGRAAQPAAPAPAPTGATPLAAFLPPTFGG